MKHILEEIALERQRQDNKFGEQNNSPIEWIAILGEEFGEASKDASEYHFRYDSPSGQPCSEALQQLRLELYRKELIETAAVCVNAIESLERNELKNKVS